MRKRTKARQITLQYLYQIDLLSVESDQEKIDLFLLEPQVCEEVKNYSTKLLNGGFENKQKTNEIIVKVARHWDIHLFLLETQACGEVKDYAINLIHGCLKNWRETNKVISKMQQAQVSEEAKEYTLDLTHICFKNWQEINKAIIKIAHNWDIYLYLFLLKTDIPKEIKEKVKDHAINLTSVCLENWQEINKAIAKIQKTQTYEKAKLQTNLASVCLKNWQEISKATATMQEMRIQEEIKEHAIDFTNSCFEKWQEIIKNFAKIIQNWDVSEKTEIEQAENKPHNKEKNILQEMVINKSLNLEMQEIKNCKEGKNYAQELFTGCLENWQEINKSAVKVLEMHVCSEVKDYAIELINGCLENWQEINKAIAKVARNWDISRMAVVDRTVLRIAVYELLYRKDVPQKVVINEAINLGKRFSTQHSGGFINGILDNLKQRVYKAD